MSIASEEALRRWPEIDTSAGGLISQSYAERYAMRRSGFVEGALWQAEQPVTEAEIDAAASEIEDIADLHHEQFDIAGALRSCKCGFECETVVKFDSHWYRSMANAALLAARKAVMA